MSKDAFYNRNQHLLISIIFLLISMLTSGLYVIKEDGFGKNDLLPFVIWSLPLSLVFSFISKKIEKYKDLKKVTVAYLLALLGGMGIPLAYVICVAITLGPWAMAFSFPIHLFWIAGGITSLILPISLRHEKNRRILIEGVILMIFILSIGWNGDLWLRRISGERHVVVNYLEWEINGNPTSLIDEMNMLSEKGTELIDKLNLEGKLISLDQDVTGVNPDSEMIVIMPRYLTGEFRLPIPKSRLVIYILGEDSWRSFPENVRFSEQEIVIIMPKEIDGYGRLIYEYPHGGFDTIVAFKWSNLEP